MTQRRLNASVLELKEINNNGQKPLNLYDRVILLDSYRTTKLDEPVLSMIYFVIKFVMNLSQV